MYEQGLADNLWTDIVAPIALDRAIKTQMRSFLCCLSGLNASLPNKLLASIARGEIFITRGETENIACPRHSKMCSK